MRNSISKLRSLAQRATEVDPLIAKEDAEIQRLERLMGIKKFQRKEDAFMKLNKEYELEGIGSDFGSFLLDLDKLSDDILKTHSPESDASADQPTRKKSKKAALSEELTSQKSIGMKDTNRSALVDEVEEKDAVRSDDRKGTKKKRKQEEADVSSSTISTSPPVPIVTLPTDANTVQLTRKLRAQVNKLTIETRHDLFVEMQALFLSQSSTSSTITNKSKSSSKRVDRYPYGLLDIYLYVIYQHIQANALKISPTLTLYSSFLMAISCLFTGSSSSSSSNISVQYKIMAYIITYLGKLLHQELQRIAYYHTLAASSSSTTIPSKVEGDKVVHSLLFLILDLCTWQVDYFHHHHSNNNNSNEGEDCLIAIIELIYDILETLVAGGPIQSPNSLPSESPDLPTLIRALHFPYRMELIELLLNYCYSTMHSRKTYRQAMILYAEHEKEQQQKDKHQTGNLPRFQRIQNALLATIPSQLETWKAVQHSSYTRSDFLWEQMIQLINLDSTSNSNSGSMSSSKKKISRSWLSRSSRQAIEKEEEMMKANRLWLTSIMKMYHDSIQMALNNEENIRFPSAFLHLINPQAVFNHDGSNGSAADTSRINRSIPITSVVNNQTEQEATKLTSSMDQEHNNMIIQQKQIRLQEQILEQQQEKQIQKVLAKKANELHLTSPLRKAIFTVFFSCRDVIDAMEQIQSLQSGGGNNSGNKMDRDVVRVIFACLSLEKDYNPFYLQFLTLLCEQHPKSKLTIELAYCDELAALLQQEQQSEDDEDEDKDEGKAKKRDKAAQLLERRILHTARLLSELILTFKLSLSVFRKLAGGDGIGNGGGVVGIAATITSNSHVILFLSTFFLSLFTHPLAYHSSSSDHNTTGGNNNNLETITDRLARSQHMIPVRQVILFFLENMMKKLPPAIQQDADVVKQVKSGKKSMMKILKEMEILTFTTSSAAIAEQQQQGGGRKKRNKKDDQNDFD